MFTIQIPIPTLKALSRFMGKDDIRYYLNALRIEVHANVAYLVATDGHRLALARIERCDDDTMTGAGSAIIPREYVEKLKSCSKVLDYVTLTVEGEPGEDGAHPGAAFSVAVPGGPVTSGKTIDGKFPDWQKVIPRKCSGELAHFNPEYLMDCHRANNDLGSGARLCTFISIAHNGQSAALVTLSPDFIVVVMPMRAEPVMEAPEWVAENPAAVGRIVDVEEARAAALEEDSSRYPLAEAA